MTAITHRFIETNGIRMHVAEAGYGPLILLLHGFPESWYSWRHQLAALAQAGYHAVAPDQRGYGQTDRPAEIEKYTQLHLRYALDRWRGWHGVRGDWKAGGNGSLSRFSLSREAVFLAQGSPPEYTKTGNATGSSTGVFSPSVTYTGSRKERAEKCRPASFAEWMESSSDHSIQGRNASLV